MSDPFSPFIAAQREILRAQEAQIQAARAAIDAAGQAARLQKSGGQALEASTRAWLAWAKLWGWR